MANDTNTNGKNGTTTTGILAVTGIFIVAFIVIGVMVVVEYKDVIGVGAIVLAAAAAVSTNVLNLLTATEGTKQARIAAKEAAEAKVAASEAKATSLQTSKNVDGVMHELIAAKTGQATAEATLAQIGVQEEKAAVLAQATDTVTTSTTTTTLSSPATIDADVVAGVDAVIPGSEG